MNRVIYKCFFFWDTDKEEQWLNQMGLQGLKLVKIGFCTYHFEKCSNSFYYRIELLKKLPSQPQSIAYIRFLKDEMDIELVCNIMRWAYFRKNIQSDAFELYSDTASQIKHFHKQKLLSLTLAFAELCISLGNYIIYYCISGLTLNLIVAHITLALTFILSYVYWHIANRIKRLKKQELMFE